MAAPRLRNVQTQKEMQSVRDDFITQGYEVRTEGQYSLLMRKKDWGSVGWHVVIAIFTIWWTIGIGNLIYAVIAHTTAEQVMLKMEVPEVPVST